MTPPFCKELICFALLLCYPQPERMIGTKTVYPELASLETYNYFPFRLASVSCAPFAIKKSG